MHRFALFSVTIGHRTSILVIPLSDTIIICLSFDGKISPLSKTSINADDGGWWTPVYIYIIYIYIYIDTGKVDRWEVKEALGQNKMG